MHTRFTFPPSVYRRESETASYFWWTLLPLVSVVATIFVSFVYPEFANKWLKAESTGLLEFIHFLFPLIVALIAIRMLTLGAVRKDWLLFSWCLAMVLGGIYLGGEEASWGQHYIGWNTPEFWSGINDQQETNVHNTLAILDQVPRLILILGIILTGLIYPWLLLNKPEILPARFDFTFPPLALRTLAGIVFVGFIYSELIVRLISDERKEYLDSHLRTGEFSETYIVWFLLGYAIFLLRRAKTLIDDTAANA